MPAGRPSPYRPEYAEQARKLALLGWTDKQVAELFGVSATTLYAWDKAHPEFLETRARGKAVADAQVALSLWQRANGYSHDDVHVSAYEGDVTLTPIIKHYPPDFQSASLWLRNRQPELWKDKVEVSHSGRIDSSLIPYNPEIITIEQREVMRDVLLVTAQTTEETPDE